MKVLILALLLTACVPHQTQDTTQTVQAQQATVESSQDAVQSQGANVKGAVENVLTENVTGVSIQWFILGALIFGLIIPQPTILRGKPPPSQTRLPRQIFKEEQHFR